jgi:DNA-binding transcriptional regulator PaaX
MRFLGKYPVSLNELLVAPLVFRETLPLLRDLPDVSGSAMRDLAEFGGHRGGTVRTAMSRLRAAGAIEAVTANGVTRYRIGPFGRSIGTAVKRRFERPDGFLLAVFSFAADDVRERQVVREALRAHGFQKLAQNAYINGQIDTAELERVVRDNGLSDHLFLFRSDDRDPARDKRLAALFDVKRRAVLLRRFEADLRAFVEEPGISDDEFARRYLAAGPAHYRITFVEEPPLPARCLPADYPLERLQSYVELTPERSRALVHYYRRLDA